MNTETHSPVRLQAMDAPGQPPVTPELEQLYRAFEQELVVPLWTEIGDIMPSQPQSRATPHLWRWQRLRELAAQAGACVPVGRGGERRAMGLANPSLGGLPYATPTLWAAIQYLMPDENAPVHRHTQNAFRFVIEGEGVWTVVNGDPIRMSRGDFLPQPGWNWHAHYNAATAPMAWIDGLDIPFSCYMESQFFELSEDPVRPEGEVRPEFSRSERLWAHAGLHPVGTPGNTRATPLLAYRWDATNRALDEQLAMEKEGFRFTVSAGHAAVRYVNPVTGGDVMPTLRVEMHRLLPGALFEQVREVGSAVYQVFDGSGEVSVGKHHWQVQHGDLFAVPSWVPFSAQAASGSRMDLFRFSDTPIYQALHTHRAQGPGERA